MTATIIHLDGRTVRIIAERKLDIPRRQSFAWVTGARAYAERLNEERGWPIEGKRGQE